MTLQVLLQLFVTVIVLGLHPLAAALIGYVVAFYGMFQHWNVRTPHWLGYFIQRPEAHCVHHRRGVHDYNYGDLPLWDMLFGSFRNPRHFMGDCGFETPADRHLGAMLAFADVNAPLWHGQAWARSRAEPLPGRPRHECRSRAPAPGASWPSSNPAKPRPASSPTTCSATSARRAGGPMRPRTATCWKWRNAGRSAVEPLVLPRDVPAMRLRERRDRAHVGLLHQAGLGCRATGRPPPGRDPARALRLRNDQRIAAGRRASISAPPDVQGGGRDHAAAQADLAVVEHRGLARRHGPLRLAESAGGSVRAVAPRARRRASAWR